MDASNGRENSISNHELTPAKFLLKSQSFEALTRKDKEPNFHMVKKSYDIESYISNGCSSNQNWQPCGSGKLRC